MTTERRTQVGQEVEAALGEVKSFCRNAHPNPSGPPGFRPSISIPNTRVKALEDAGCGAIYA